MIPYTEFGTKGKIRTPPNPFVAHDEPIVVFLDPKNFAANELDFLLRQADGKHLNVVSTEKNGSAYLEYIERDDDVLEFNVTKSDGSSSSRYGIPSISQIKHLATIPEFTRWASQEEVESAFIAARTAENLNAHIFITKDKFLLEHKDIGIIADAFPLSLEDATALIGLIQRRRNNYKIIADRTGSSTLTSSHGRWSFFWYAARDMLPAGWQLVTSCSQMPGDRWRDMALTAISRLGDALKCRDHIHEQIFLEQTNSSTEDAIFYLDFYLISLTAAFDVLARIADEIYKPVGGNGKHVRPLTWRNKDWLDALGRQDTKLAGMMAGKSSSRDVLEFIAILRNYVHAEGLQGSMHTKNGKPAPLLLRVPSTEVSIIDGIIKRLGNGKWRVDNPAEDVMFLEIGDLVERITPLAAAVINQLMQSIDIKKIGGLDMSNVQTKAPEKWLSQKDLEGIRKLLGV